jgi:hypothetical protein
MILNEGGVSEWVSEWVVEWCSGVLVSYHNLLIVLFVMSFSLFSRTVLPLQKVLMRPEQVMRSFSSLLFRPVPSRCVGFVTHSLTHLLSFLYYWCNKILWLLHCTSEMVLFSCMWTVLSAGSRILLGTLPRPLKWLFDLWTEMLENQRRLVIYSLIELFYCS